MKPTGMTGQWGLRLRRAAIAIIAVMSCLCADGALAADGEFTIMSDHKADGGGTELCIAVDRTAPIVPARGAQVIPPVAGAAAIQVSGTFYPVVVTACASPDANLVTKWSFDDGRELRATVDGKPMCLSARYMTSFEPLLDPYLKAFHAFDAGAPFAYLAAQLKPDGKPGARLHSTPDLVVSACGRTDAADFWVYDDRTETISGPGGWDDKGLRQHQCLTIHGDDTSKPPKIATGMPVTVDRCPDLWTYSPAAPDLRWHLSSPAETRPTYTAPEPKDYFNGASGLPIVGPMGRCLTADFPLRIAVTSDCDGRREQDWKINGDIVQLGPKGDCLTRAADQSVTLTACSNTANQHWSFVVRDPVPNPKWLNAELFGQFHPKDSPDQCMVGTDDPFADPIRQRNRLKVASCTSVRPRQTSWFRSEAVRTVRLALLRDSNDDGSSPALGKMTDDDARRTMEEFASRLSQEYHVLGIRFVFDPAHDYIHSRDTVANRETNDSKQPHDFAAENRNVQIAANDFFGKATIVTTINFRAGGFSSANLMDFDPTKSLDPISGKTSFNAAHKAAGIPVDRADLPAFSYYIGESGIGTSISDVAHHAHEFGHYLSLFHTFQPDEFADTPEDVGTGSVYYPLGSVSCGNARTVKSGAKSVTPDRNNNQGYWGCNLGRTLNSFSPLQLAKANWVLQNQLNRYPLVACQPLHNYDADHVECENAESLALCRETAEYLRKKMDVTLECVSGGRYGRALAAALQYPAVAHLLRDTPVGRSLVNKLGGQAARDTAPPAAVFDAVTEALKTGKNLAVTMSLVGRFRELEQLTAQRSPALAKAGFAANGGTIGSHDQALLATMAGELFSPAFIAAVPAIVAR